MLKLLRYGSRLGWWCCAGHRGGDIAERLQAFEKTCAAARKAVRIGKFLNNADAAADALRDLAKARASEKIAGATSTHINGDTNLTTDVTKFVQRASKSEAVYAALTVGAEVCDGTYFLIDNILWLHKAGIIKRLRFGDTRAYEVRASVAELIGYIFFEAPRLAISLHRIQRELLMLEVKEAKDGGRSEGKGAGISAEGPTTSASSAGDDWTSIGVPESADRETLVDVSAPAAAAASSSSLAALAARIEARKFEKLVCVLALVKITADGLLAVNTLRGMVH